ncbi:MAG: hypothetical protein K9H26_10860 [Prolixibacteraceae bacterium]|nr:hypothetical protein [Prolixibacteraceae bacterium]
MTSQQFTINFEIAASKSRKREHVKHRKQAAFQLFKDGFKETEIARIIDRTQQGISYLISNV